MKRAISTITLLVLMISTFAFANAVGVPVIVPTTQQVIINGKVEKFYPYNIGGSNYCKLRDIAYFLKDDFNVTWSPQGVVIWSHENYVADGSENSYSFRRNFDYRSFQGASTDKLFVHENSRTAEVFLTSSYPGLAPMYKINGNNYIQVSALQQIVDISVKYNSRTNSVEIYSLDHAYAPQVTPTPHPTLTPQVYVEPAPTPTPKVVYRTRTVYVTPRPDSDDEEDDEPTPTNAPKPTPTIAPTPTPTPIPTPDNEGLEGEIPVVDSEFPERTLTVEVRTYDELVVALKNELVKTLEVRNDITVPKGDSITIPDGMSVIVFSERTLTIDGELTVEKEALLSYERGYSRGATSVRVNGTAQIYGSAYYGVFEDVISSGFDGSGTIRYYGSFGAVATTENSYVEFYDNTTKIFGDYKVNTDNQFDGVFGEWSHGSVTIAKDSSLTVEKGASIDGCIVEGTLTIDNDATLVIKDSIWIAEDEYMGLIITDTGVLNIDEFATIRINGDISIDESSIINGTLNIPSNKAVVTTQEELAIAVGTGYDWNPVKEIIINGDISWRDQVSLESDIKITIEKDASLTLSQNDNRQLQFFTMGVFNIKDGGRLHISNGWDFTVGGISPKEGRLTIDRGGVVEVEGVLSTNRPDGGIIINNGTITGDGQYPDNLKP